MCGEQKVVGWTMRPFSESFQKIADAHNAALVDEQENTRKWAIEAHDSAKSEQQLREQLAAEREKVENLHKILGQKRTTIKELREQLAAEREKREQSDRKWIVVAGQLRKQLAVAKVGK